MKLTKRQIDTIIENTPTELKGYHHNFIDDFGWYMKSGANWSYRVGWVRRDIDNTSTELVLAVKVFGVIQ